MNHRREEDLDHKESPCSCLISGVHSVRIPASDPWASRDWYVAVLAFESILDLEDADGLLGVLLRHRFGLEIALHHDPLRGRGRCDYERTGVSSALASPGPKGPPGCVRRRSVCGVKAQLAMNPVADRRSPLPAA